MSGSADFSVAGLSVVGLARVKGRFQGAARRLHDRLYGVMISEADQVADLARARMAELFRNPARMQAAIRVSSADDIGSSNALIRTEVSATGLPYLAIHEYGGVTAPHTIFPASAVALRFVADGRAVFRTGATAGTDVVFTKVVHHPGSKMPERSYLRYALAQRAGAIRAAFAQAASDTLGGGG